MIRYLTGGCAWLVAAAWLATGTGCGGSALGREGPSTDLPAGDESTAQAEAEAAPETILELEQQSDWAPTEPYWPYRLAEVQLSAGDPVTAEQHLRESLRRDAFYPPALSLLSRIYFETGRHQQAIDLLEAARAEPERFPGGVPQALLEGLALHYDTVDEVERAESVLAAIPPGQIARGGSPAVYLRLRGDEPARADEMALAALKENDKSAVNQNNYGITRLRAGDPTGARKAFLRAIELDPALPGPYYNLAILEKYYAFDDESAQAWFGKYQKRSTEDPDGLSEVFEVGVSESISKGTQ